jgi:hypothetical protein
MRPDGAFMPPRADSRMVMADVPARLGFVQRVLLAWDHGLDTKAIALALCEREAVVAFALRLGLEQRRAA